MRAPNNIISMLLSGISQYNGNGYSSVSAFRRRSVRRWRACYCRAMAFALTRCTLALGRHMPFDRHHADGVRATGDIGCRNESAQRIARPPCRRSGEIVGRRAPERVSAEPR